MKTNFDYNSVPDNFTHCLNKQCSHAADCLRHQVALHIPSERDTINIVNPVYAAANGGENCSFFSSICVLFSHSFLKLWGSFLDKIPHSDAVVIKQQMLEHFGRNAYYRFRRKEQLITPSEQKYIRQLFRKKGITDEPIYDEYVERYEW